MRRLRRDERGQTIVEFALMLPIFLLLVTGLFDVARAVWQENTLAYAAREGTRYAIVRGSGAGTDAVYPSNTQPVIDRVRNSAIGVADVTVTAAWPDSSCYDRGCRVQVDARAPFIPLPSQYLLGGAFSITLRGGSSLVIQR